MNYMVVYWNGRATREKYFVNRTEALELIHRIEDKKATLWVKEIIDG